MSDKLVSVITPCYNTAQYLPRLLDSLLRQSYQYMEVIAVDDGSTDDTMTVLSSYAKRFEEKGYSYQVLHQENQGQSVAINRALKLIHGDYLLWPDSDDYYASDEAIEKMVGALERSDNSFRMVRSQVKIVRDPDLQPIKTEGEGRPYEEESTLFDDMIFYRNGFYFSSGVYMVDVVTLRELTDMDIYTTRLGGQNWQLVLPILYHHRCLTIAEPLYHIVERSSSHSRGQFVGVEKETARNEAYRSILYETLSRIKGMPEAQLKDYLQRVMEKFDLQRLAIAIRSQDKLYARIALEEAKTHGTQLPTIIHAIGCLVAHPLGNHIYRAYKRLSVCLRNIISRRDR